MSIWNMALGWGKRLLTLLLSVFLLVTAVFYVSRLAPGDPLVAYYGDRVERMTPDERTPSRCSMSAGWAGPSTGTSESPINIKWMRRRSSPAGLETP